MFKLGYTPNAMPCTQNCPNRSPTCKFDGTCNKYSEWKAAEEKAREERMSKNIYYKVNGRKRALSPGISGGRK